MPENNFTPFTPNHAECSPQDPPCLEGFTVDWDENGNIATDIATDEAENDLTYTFNWDNKLREAKKLGTVTY